MNLFSKIKLCKRPILSLFVLSSLVVSSLVKADDKKEIILLNWEDYMPAELLFEFYAKTGYRVTQSYYTSENQVEHLVLANKGVGFDLILSSKQSMEKFKEIGDILAKIPPDAIPNSRYTAERWRKATENIKDFASPIMWGTLGIIYRSDLVEQDIDSWNILFQANDQIGNKISMLDTPRDNMTAALLSLGLSPSTTNQDDLLAAAKVLQQQRPNVKAYRYSDGSWIGTGEAVLALGYNSDAVNFGYDNSNIAFALPEGPVSLWMSMLAVTQSSTKKEAAFAFINFLQEPENAAILSEYLSTATTNEAAEKLLPAWLKEDTNLYPAPERMADAEFVSPLPKELHGAFNNFYNHAVSGVVESNNEP